MGYENYEHYLRSGELRHNLLVLVLALVDLTADAYHFTVASAGDSLSAFAEFCLRFGLFRNAVMGLEVLLRVVSPNGERCFETSSCNCGLWRCRGGSDTRNASTTRWLPPVSISYVH